MCVLGVCMFKCIKNLKVIKGGGVGGGGGLVEVVEKLWVEITVRLETES